jgi:hypothetical protein
MSHGSDFVSIKALHHREFKIRLTDDDADNLKELAVKLDLTPTALARTLIKRSLDEQSEHALLKMKSQGDL